MNIITSIAAQTMTSREIAELTGKEHKNVMADVRSMLEQLEIQPADFSAGYIAGNGQAQPMFNLPKDLVLTLVSGYSVVLRKRIIDRWQDLEAAAPKSLDLSDPAALRNALLAYSERVMALEDKVTADAPKVAFAEIIRAVDGVCHIGNIGKMFNIGRTKFFKMLRDDDILMSNNLPYQKYIDRGYFTVVEQEPYTDTKGVSHPTFTAMVTGAGQVFLAKRYKALGGA